MIAPATPLYNLIRTKLVIGCNDKQVPTAVLLDGCFLQFGGLVLYVISLTLASMILYCACAAHLPEAIERQRPPTRRNGL
jgi:hypothetical protein